MAAPLTVYYWPMFGRGGPVCRMLEHAGIAYVHKSEFPEIASLCSAFGASTDTFAPPVVVDGELTLSQSVPCAIYIGRKCGLCPPEGTEDAKSFQHLMDIIDFYEIGIDGAKGKGGAALKQFLEGDRFVKQKANIERGIQGPFYYGEKPCYVDFVLCAQQDWIKATLLDRLKAEKGVNAFAEDSKIMGVVNGIRNLDSYKNYSGPLGTIRPGFECKDELIAQYE